MERDILLRYRDANNYSLTLTVTVHSNLINEVIDKWNSVGVAPFIYRHTCFICDAWGNIYKDTDNFFVGDSIAVFKRPDIGKTFLSFFPVYSTTRVHTDAGELSRNVKDLNGKGDCYMVFRNSNGERGLYAEETRIENLRKIKIANALSNNMNQLELYARQKGTSIQDLLPIIGKMATDLDVRLPVKAQPKRVKKEEEDEGGPICVIV